MEEATVNHLFKFEHKDDFSGRHAYLSNPKTPVAKTLAALKQDFPGLVDDHTLVSRRAVVRARPVVNGDVAFWEGMAGEMQAGHVWLHADIAGDLWTCVAKWEFIRRDGRIGHFRVRAEHAWLPTGRLLESAIWSRATPGEISRVLIPIHLARATLGG